MTDQYPDGYLDAHAAPASRSGRKGDPRGAGRRAGVPRLGAAGGYVTGQTLAVDGGMTIT